MFDPQKRQFFCFCSSFRSMRNFDILLAYSAQGEDENATEEAAGKHGRAVAVAL